MEDLKQETPQQISKPTEKTSASPGFKKPTNSVKFMFIFALISSLIAFGVGGYVLGQKDLPAGRQGKSNPSAGGACTQDAKICPDGSSVGRTGPNCEFSPCPKAQPSPTPDPTANWKTYTYKTFSVRLSDRWTQEKPWGDNGGRVRLIEGISFKAEGDPYIVSFQVTDDPYPLSDLLRYHPDGKNTSLDGQPAFKFITIAGQAADEYQPTIQSNHAGKRFILWISAGSNDPAVDEEFNQILQTFKFLD